MDKCTSDLDCLQDIDDRISRIGQAVTEFEITYRYESGSNINYLLIPILIILIFILFTFVVVLTRSRSCRSASIELRPLTEDC